VDILNATYLAIIEGFTEFLPISSTGHMIVASKYLGVDQTSLTKAYEVIIQLSAILAVVFNYSSKFTFQKISLWSKVVVSFLPIGVVGYIFRDEIKELFTVQTVAWMFIVGGVVFLVVEYFYKEKEHYVSSLEDITWKQSVAIGLAQIFSLIPGASRAGATIIGALLSGINRKVSAEYSFLLALPVMIAVSGYDLLKHYNEFQGES
jgi:undecaprenyl-diphosphatase